MTFIDITCMSDRSEEVIIETFPRRNDTPFFTTRSCRLTPRISLSEIAVAISMSNLKSDLLQYFTEIVLWYQLRWNFRRY